MKSRRSSAFRTQFERLPFDVQHRAQVAFRQFQTDPFHHGLRFKEVSSQDGWWSARIGDSYRALGVRDRDEIVWFWIGTHAEYDKILRIR